MNHKFIQTDDFFYHVGTYKPDTQHEAYLDSTIALDFYAARMMRDAPGHFGIPQFRGTESYVWHAKMPKLPSFVTEFDGYEARKKLAQSLLKQVPKKGECSYALSYCVPKLEPMAGLKGVERLVAVLQMVSNALYMHHMNAKDVYDNLEFWRVNRSENHTYMWIYVGPGYRLQVPTYGVTCYRIFCTCHFDKPNSLENFMEMATHYLEFLEPDQVTPAMHERLKSPIHVLDELAKKIVDYAAK